MDVCMTATARPGIVYRTCESFRKTFGDIDARLLLNVDPVGGGDPAEVVHVAEKFFHSVTARIPNEPSFPRAVIWLWSEASGDFFLHLEDDWEFLRAPDVGLLLSCFGRNHCGSVRLPSVAYVDKNGFKSERVYSGKTEWLYYGGCFWLGEQKKLSLNPTFFSRRFAWVLSKLMDPEKNPEKQLWPGTPDIANWVSSWHHALLTGMPGEAVVFDIGRDWIEQSGWKKPSSDFTKWERE